MGDHGLLSLRELTKATEDTQARLEGIATRLQSTMIDRGGIARMRRKGKGRMNLAQLRMQRDKPHDSELKTTALGARTLQEIETQKQNVQELQRQRHTIEANTRTLEQRNREVNAQLEHLQERLREVDARYSDEKAKRDVAEAERRRVKAELDQLVEERNRVEQEVASTEKKTGDCEQERKAINDQTSEYEVSSIQESKCVQHSKRSLRTSVAQLGGDGTSLLNADNYIEPSGETTLASGESSAHLQSHYTDFADANRNGEAFSTLTGVSAHESTSQIARRSVTKGEETAGEGSDFQLTDEEEAMGPDAVDTTTTVYKDFQDNESLPSSSDETDDEESDSIADLPDTGASLFVNGDESREPSTSDANTAPPDREQIRGRGGGSVGAAVWEEDDLFRLPPSYSPSVGHESVRSEPPEGVRVPTWDPMSQNGGDSDELVGSSDGEDELGETRNSEFSASDKGYHDVRKVQNAQENEQTNDAFVYDLSTGRDEIRKRLLSLQDPRALAHAMIRCSEANINIADMFTVRSLNIICNRTPVSYGGTKAATVATLLKWAKSL